MPRPRFVSSHCHRRPADLLAGLSPAMKAAIRDAGLGLMQAASADYWVEGSENTHRRSTIHALAERGLLTISAGPRGDRDAYKLTRRGNEVVNELIRRQQNRIKLFGPSPSPLAGEVNDKLACRGGEGSAAT